MFKRSIAIYCLALATAVGASAADVTRFRGDNGLGTTDRDVIPSDFDAALKRGWKRELPGPGASSPISVGGKIYVTCYSGYGSPDAKESKVESLKRWLVCVDAKSGEIVWSKDVPSLHKEDSYQGFLQSHGYATQTPASDGKRIFTFFGKSGVFAFDAQTGEPLWNTEVGTGSAMMNWGAGTSLLHHDGVVIVTAAAESKALIGLDSATGKELWKTEAPGFEGCWSTPALVTTKDGKKELVLNAPYEVWGFDPKKGALTWFCKGIEENVMCPSVVAKDGVVYAIGGRQGGALAITAGGKDDVSETHVLWRSKAGAYVTSPVISGDHLYWTGDNRVMKVGLTKGEVDQTRIDGMGQIYASPLLSGNKMLVVTRGNGVFVFLVEPSLQLASKYKFEGDSSIFNASPIEADGKLYIRSDTALYCLAP